MNLNQITIELIIPLWLITLLYSLGLTAALIQYRLIRGKLGKKRALIVSFLRLGSISFIVAFSLNPSLVTEKVHRVAPAVAASLTSPEAWIDLPFLANQPALIKRKPL